MGAEGGAGRPVFCCLCLSHDHVVMECERPAGAHGVPPREWCKRVVRGFIVCTRRRDHIGPCGDEP